MPTTVEDLPGTLKRSPESAQRLYEKVLDDAHHEYHDERRAHQTAYAALKHSFEKVGDHWEPRTNEAPPTSAARHPAGEAARQREGSTSKATPRTSCTRGPRSSTCRAAPR